MRTSPVLTVTAIAITSIGAAAYYSSRDHALPRTVDVAQPAVHPTSGSNESSVRIPDAGPGQPVNLEPPSLTPITDERRDQPAKAERRELALMTDKLVALEARLRAMEAIASEQAQDHLVSRPDPSEPGKGAKKAKAKLSEGEFGQWMDQVLNAGDFDGHASESIANQMKTSLAEMPGVTLTDMRCGGRFCRASLVSEDGTQPNISQLVGGSPFIGSGFTVAEPDGRVKVYFTQPGQSLTELRSEALEHTLTLRGEDR
jgi:hypothetical protein